MPAQTIHSGLTTDSTFAFSSSSGWTLTGDAQIGSGVLDLAAGVTTGTAESPDLDRSLWGSLVQCSIEATEAVASSAQAYYHRLLFSFDSGTTWRRHYRGGWVRANEALISGDGMTVDYVQQIREWPAGNSIRVQIYIERTDAGASGSMDFIHFGHGSAAFEFTDQPATDSTTFPFAIAASEVDFTEHSVQHDLGTAHVLSYATATDIGQARRLRWPALDATDRDTLLAYLEAHKGPTNAFDWQPQGEGSTLVWYVVDDPSWSSVAPNASGQVAYVVQCTVRSIP